MPQDRERTVISKAQIAATDRLVERLVAGIYDLGRSLPKEKRRSLVEDLEATAKLLSY